MVTQEHQSCSTILLLIVLATYRTWSSEIKTGITQYLYLTDKQPSLWNDDRGTCLAFRVTSWPLVMNAEGHVLKHEVTSLSVRPLLFHPCLTILLSPSLMLSRAAVIAPSVYSSYCMTYTWRVFSLFIFRSPTAWAQLSAVCITSATVSSLTFSSSGTHRRSAAFIQTWDPLGVPRKWKGQIKQTLCWATSYFLQFALVWTWMLRVYFNSSSWGPSWCCRKMY